MTPVPPTQPPAAPEGEVRLTDAERRAFWRAMCEWNDVDDGFGRDKPSNAILYAAVERIVAERVRVVEGERDAALEKAVWWERTCAYWHEQATEAQRFRDMNAAHAKSAEAAHRALQAAVEALAGEHEAIMNAILPMPNRDERESGRRTVRRLRELAGGEER